jgi:exopolyphosphatase/guanosine-5'-triphosphate,3'-diphosphate pyrophosphatase
LGDVVVLDIGGGSTELILQYGGRIEVASLDLGCVRLTERYLHHDPPLPGELVAATAAIARELDRAEAMLPALGSLSPTARLVGLAGTVSTLSALDQELVDYDRERLHHSSLGFDDVDRWCATLAGEAASARARRPGMVPGREDVIVGGVVVLREVMSRFGCSECLVSESDILDGLVASVQE